MTSIATSQLAYALIAVFEGERLRAYLDSGGIPTIGFGHTKNVKLGDVCTSDQAAAWMLDDSAHLLLAVSSLRPVTAAAIVSFGYNCGYNAMLRAVKDPKEILDPAHATDRSGATLSGLVARRRLEYSLCQVAS